MVGVRRQTGAAVTAVETLGQEPADRFGLDEIARDAVALYRGETEHLAGFFTGLDGGVAPPALSPIEVGAITAAIGHSIAPSTRAAYQFDWSLFRAWCAQRGFPALPAHPAVVAAYLSTQAALREPAARTGGEVKWRWAPASLDRQLSAINRFHAGAGYGPPGKHEVVRRAMGGIRRVRSTRPARRRPLLLDDVRAIVDAARVATGFPDAVAERRDSLLILLGFAGGFRRSELVALRCADVAREGHYGLYVLLRRSKTDQEGVGQRKAVPFGSLYRTCVPCAYARWLEVLDAWRAHGRPGVMRLVLDAAPFVAHVCLNPAQSAAADTQQWLFPAVSRAGNMRMDSPLSGSAVNAVIARRATAAGYARSFVAALGGHSLRAGFVTQATRNGSSTAAIMRQTGHTSPATVEIYRREHAPETGNAVADIGM